MSRVETVALTCDVCGIPTGPTDYGLAPDEEVIETPLEAPAGWLTITVARIMPNPDRAAFDAEPEPTPPAMPTLDAEAPAYLQAMQEYSRAQNDFDNREVPPPYIVQQRLFHVHMDYAHTLAHAIPGCWEDDLEFVDLQARYDAMLAAQKAPAPEPELETPAPEAL